MRNRECYKISYSIVLKSKTIEKAPMRVKNCQNEMHAKVKLNDYCKKQHGGDYVKIIVHNCELDLMESIFPGM